MLIQNNKYIDAKNLSSRILDEVHRTFPVVEGDRLLSYIREEIEKSSEEDKTFSPSSHHTENAGYSKEPVSYSTYDTVENSPSTHSHSSPYMYLQRIKDIPILGPFALWVWSLVRIHPVRKGLFELHQTVKHLSDQLQEEIKKREQAESQYHTLLKEWAVEQKNRQQETTLQQQRWQEMLEGGANRCQCHVETKMQAYAAERIQSEIELKKVVNTQLEHLEQTLELQQKTLLMHSTVLDTLPENEKKKTDDLHRILKNQEEIQTLLLQCQREMLFQQRRLTKLVDEIGSIPSGVLHPFPLESLDRESDAFYDAFEETFRGKREDIKNRLKIYLNEFYWSGIGGNDMPILDIGCGRGEWLEIVSEANLVGKGIDTNILSIETCQKQGFHAEYGKAPGYMADIPDETLGAITAFHVIEHLTLKEILAFFDEALRTLKSGGLIILETPNPENILVGACTFYNDPTHVHPLPPRVLEFIAQQRGFSDIRVERFHPYPHEEHVADDSDLGQRFNTLFYGAQDYSVIARKL